MEFKGTKGELELKFAGPICIGIGTVGEYSQITANTILPETDEEYLDEMDEIEGNMRLYASAPELLEVLISAEKNLIKDCHPSVRVRIQQAINKALGK